MSGFSGRCDLYDHIMMEKMYPSENNSNLLISDEMECFKIFHEKTGGVIYQKFPLELNEFNIDAEISFHNNPQILHKIEHVEHIPDKRVKSGIRTKVYYTYMYYGKEYKTLKDLNRRVYYATKEIHFRNIIDLIPYYPYTIAIACCTRDNGKYIEIADTSEIEDRYASYRKHGNDPKYLEHYTQQLQDHYIEIVNKYYKE